MDKNPFWQEGLLCSGCGPCPLPPHEFRTLRRPCCRGATVKNLSRVVSLVLASSALRDVPLFFPERAPFEGCFCWWACCWLPCCWLADAHASYLSLCIVEKASLRVTATALTTYICMRALVSLGVCWLMSCGWLAGCWRAGSFSFCVTHVHAHVQLHLHTFYTLTRVASERTSCARACAHACSPIADSVTSSAAQDAGGRT